jgi:hypothetical protein
MRELMTQLGISSWITARLRSFPECADAEVTVQYELHEPEADGCNWSRDLVINYGRSDSQAVQRRLRPLCKEARRRFNIDESSVSGHATACPH